MSHYDKQLEEWDEKFNVGHEYNAVTLTWEQHKIQELIATTNLLAEIVEQLEEIVSKQGKIINLLIEREVAHMKKKYGGNTVDGQLANIYLKMEELKELGGLDGAR